MEIIVLDEFDKGARDNSLGDAVSESN